MKKNFSSILQQEREFNTTFSSTSEDSIANSFNEGHGKHFRGGFSNNRR